MQVVSSFLIVILTQNLYWNVNTFSRIFWLSFYLRSRPSYSLSCSLQAWYRISSPLSRKYWGFGGCRMWRMIDHILWTRTERNQLSHYICIPPSLYQVYDRHVYWSQSVSMFSPKYHGHRLFTSAQIQLVLSLLGQSLYTPSHSEETNASSFICREFCRHDDFVWQISRTLAWMNTSLISLHPLELLGHVLMPSTTMDGRPRLFWVSVRSGVLCHILIDPIHKEFHHGLSS